VGSCSPASRQGLGSVRVTVTRISGPRSARRSRSRITVHQLAAEVDRQRQALG
jgi:hypothetical protein